MSFQGNTRRRCSSTSIKYYDQRVSYKNFSDSRSKLLPQQWQWAQTMLDLDEVEESDLELSDESGEEEEECGNLSWSFPELNEVASSVPEAVVAEAQESIAL